MGAPKLVKVAPGQSRELFQCVRYEGFPEVRQEIRDRKSPMPAKMDAKKHKKLIAGRGSNEEEEIKVLFARCELPGPRDFQYPGNCGRFH